MKGICFTHIDQAAAEATRATNLLDRLDSSTLAKAFRGELVEPLQTAETEMVISQ